MPELKFDSRNYRIHGDKNKKIIRKSLEDCGAGRSVLVDKDNVLIAGNGVYEQALELGLKVRFVESNGQELIVVKRTDLSGDDEKRKLLALADNYSSDTSVFDFDLILEDFSADELDAWEFDVHVDDLAEELGKELYTKKINAPIYEPKNEKPKLSDLVDNSKSDQLIQQIEKSSLSEKEKDFLKMAAFRHIVFDYEKIADYYAHASKECQELMESSFLVIIDFQKALELGYAKLSEEVAEQYLNDYEDE